MEDSTKLVVFIVMCAIRASVYFFVGAFFMALSRLYIKLDNYLISDISMIVICVVMYYHHSVKMFLRMKKDDL